MPHNINQTIGRNISEHREMFDMSQEYLSNLLNITVEDMRQLENGAYPLSIHMLIRLAEIFDCPVDMLCGLPASIRTDLLTNIARLSNADTARIEEIINCYTTLRSDELKRVACNLLRGIARLDTANTRVN